MLEWWMRGVGSAEWMDSGQASIRYKTTSRMVISDHCPICRSPHLSSAEPVAISPRRG
jgi:hypothetical protein